MFKISIPAYYKPFVVFVSFEIAIYSFVIDFINSNLSLVLCFIFLILSLIYYLVILRVKVDKTIVWDKLSKIKLSTKNQGSDALCCFLSPKVKDIPYKREKDSLLIRSALTKVVTKSDSIKDIYLNHNPQIYAVNKKCSKLKNDYYIQDGDLIINFSCSIYEDRPQACKDYPYPQLDEPCRLGQYCSSPCTQIKYLDWSYIFLYAFDSKVFKDLEPYSVGFAYNFFRKYYIVPVPYQNIPETIFC